MNPDMQGYLVRLSNFLTHIGVAILIGWSTKSPRTYYGLLFLQIIFVLIGVLVSIRRNQIGIDDAEFAVILTRSPVCTYCVLLVLPRLFVKSLAPKANSAVCNLKRLSTDPAVAWKGLIADLNCQAVFDGLCGIFTLVLCLALNISVQLNGFTKVYSSIECGTGECWRTAVRSDIGSVYRWVGLVGISFVIYECVLARHKRLRWKLMGTLAARHPSIRKTFFWKRGVCGFCATWYIAARLHPWIPFLYVAILFEDWSRQLNIWTVEKDFVLSYGQFLALGPAVPVVLKCLMLAIHRGSDIRNIPKLFLRDVIWIVCGKGDPWARDEPELDDVWNAFPPDFIQRPLPVIQVDNGFEGEGEVRGHYLRV
ncbi:hypothetical protein MVEN_02214100 [Mycena venus]|uniref:Uncharacterized protein n=1 Tax=Mycena venus TaxID=2733690 RepID=A0A8H6X6W6_9AGAR|nr:hypothetical protein MVEN_02214100 [Mycena venus]